MNSTFLLKGLTCPHCSAAIEREVAKLEGVSNSSVNLVNQTLTVTAEEMAVEGLLADVKSIVYSHEPAVVVELKTEESKRNQNAGENNNPDRLKIIRLIAGAVIYIVAIVLMFFTSISFVIKIGAMILSYVILGGDVVFKALRNILKGRVFDENFLMTISTIGAFAIGEYPEAVAVMLFYQLGEFFQDLAVKRSKKSISSLMNIRPDSASVLRDGELIVLPPEDVAIGETIVVKPGEKIPLDGVVLSGESMLDTSALTGESVPRKVRYGDAALSGCVNQSGVLNIEVRKSFGESTVSKIIDLVENASSRKAQTEKFITKFSRYYTPIVVILALLLAVVPPLVLGGGWPEWLNRGFVFLVISCPCALVISVPLSYFGGIGAASKKGVLIKGGNYLEALADLETVVFDKTGTLTEGVFRVSEIRAENGFSEEEVLSIAASGECMSNHPIARSIIEEYGKDVDESAVKDYAEISGKGVAAKVNGKKIFVGNKKLMSEYGIGINECDKTGTVVYVAQEGIYAGCIVISDRVKNDSKRAIASLKALGVDRTVMLTGDNEEIADAVSKQVGIDEHHSNLLPDRKVEKVEQLMKKKGKGKLAFVGDGINDAPVLARADIGVAMGGLGSDAAIEAADVVLMTDEPSKLVDAVKLSRATRRIVKQNIIFALTIKVLLLVLGAFGVAGMWEAVFGDVGVMILAVLNAMRILRK